MIVTIETDINLCEIVRFLEKSNPVEFMDEDWEDLHELEKVIQAIKNRKGEI